MVVLISGAQQSESVIHIHTLTFLDSFEFFFRVWGFYF